MNRLLTIGIIFLSISSSCTCNAKNEKTDPKATSTEDSLKLILPPGVDPANVKVDEQGKVYSDIVSNAGTPIADSSGVKFLVTRNTEGHIGYFITIDGVRVVQQFTIPAAGGYFASEDDAKKVATLVVDKIKNNIQPPAVSIQELDELKIKY